MTFIRLTNRHGVVNLRNIDEMAAIKTLSSESIMITYRDGTDEVWKVSMDNFEHALRNHILVHHLTEIQLPTA